MSVKLLPHGRTFRLLWTANLAASLANWSWGFALTVRIYTLTKSPAATSALLVAATVPAIALGVLGGAAADRFRRDRILKIISWLRVLTAAALMLGDDRPVALCAVAALRSAQSQFFFPAEQATVADVVSTVDLAAAVSANAMTRNIARLAGPALGGVSITQFGFAATVIAICVMLIVAAVLLSSLPASTVPARSSGTVFRDGIDGLRVTFADRVTRSVAVFQILDSIKEGPLTVLFPVIMLGTIGSTAAYMGTVNSSFALTAVLGAPLVAVLTRRLGFRGPIAAGAIICGVLLLVLACAPSRSTALVTFALSGFPFTISWIAASSWLLAKTDPGYRGRVTGTTSTLNSAATATFGAIAGAAAETLPATTVLAAAAIIQTIAGPALLIMTRNGPSR